MENSIFSMKPEQYVEIHVQHGSDLWKYVHLIDKGVNGSQRNLSQALQSWKGFWAVSSSGTFSMVHFFSAKLPCKFDMLYICMNFLMCNFSQLGGNSPFCHSCIDLGTLNNQQ